MLLASIGAVALSFQSIDGVKAIPDAGPKFASAYFKQVNDNLSMGKTPDYFVVGYFMSKAKVISAVVNTKYTAAQMIISSAVLGFYDEKLGAAIKVATERITKGAKDFDSFTKPEQEAVAAAFTVSPINAIAKEGIKQDILWRFYSGSQAGMLAGYLTCWYISPKQEILLKFIGESVEGCAERATKPEATSYPELSASFKGFEQFKGKTIDDATARALGVQLEATLKSALPAEYRWKN